MVTIYDDPYDDDWWWEAWLDRNYGGAPDECNIHWPTKLVDGKCPECEASNV